MENSLATRFDSIYQKLLIIDLHAQLPGHADEQPPSLTEVEIRHLITLASILSTRDLDADRAKAYEICTRIIEIEEKPSSALVSSIDFVLSRLANFPGRSLLRANYSAELFYQKASDSPVSLALEQLVREIENTPSDLGDDAPPLTDFQFDLLEAMTSQSSVSVSAPTSAGKSYALRIDTVRRLRRGQHSIVHVVPTRALIREVSTSIRAALRQADLVDIPVRTAPFPVSKEDAPNGLIYVLTQERLLSLLNSRDVPVWITTLIVDEAHNIQDDARGVVLESAIETVLRRFPGLQVHFASPLSSNPGFLLDLFHRSGYALIERRSPVSQNLLFVSEVRGRTQAADFTAQVGDSYFNLGRRQLAFRFRGDACGQRAALAAAITRVDESTIIFANGPADAEKTAVKLCELLPESESATTQIIELVEFIREEIHPAYSLVPCLLKGVGFHFGHMPPIIRARVEDLYRQGDLKFLSCTSTLLQGVNLPARHVIVENPKRGNMAPMPRRDFLNLAGRAGRLLKEFHGNVWCVRPASWATKVFEGEPLVEMSSAISNAMTDGGTLAQKSLSDNLPQSQSDYGEALVGKLYADYLRSDRQFNADSWETDSNKESLEKTRDAITSLNIRLPIQVIEENRGIRPDKLQLLYDRISAESSSEALVPLNPWVQGANDRLMEIIRTLLIVIEKNDNNQYRYYAWLAAQWIHNVSLGRIIRMSLERRPLEDKETLSARIQDLLRILENTIRFRLVKYFTAYNAVLEVLLLERGRSDLVEKLEPIHLYLECGASDPNTLNLIALGLSRTTALAVTGKVAFPSNASPEVCLGILSGSQFSNLQIPSICKREIRELLGRDTDH